MLKGMAVLLVFQLAGEALAAAFRLPVSGPIIAVALLLMWLQARGRIDDGLASAADGLLANMAVLFVPVGVGAMAHHELFRQHWPFIAVALPVGLVTTIATTALTAKLLTRMRTRAVRQTRCDHVSCRRTP
jgi:holin-like protein